jgi:hypothetical protein
MTLEKRIEAFSALGHIIRSALEGEKTLFSEKLLSLADNQHIHNPWFTPAYVRMAISAIADNLTEEKLKRWTGKYPGLEKDYKPLKAGVIMAGNIPLVGFHDFLSVLISGNKIIAKTSSKDPVLLPFLAEILGSVDSDFKNYIRLEKDAISDFDIVIATGSDNSARYFDYYFGRYPNIIRKNRNSIAVLDGEESDADLENLGLDLFSYFGLGCRNVSKIYIPEGFDLERLTSAWKKYSGIISHGKYASNYEFNMAVYLVNREEFTDTGFLLMKESTALSSPVAVLFYEYYKSFELLLNHLDSLSDMIQCIAGKNGIPFGTANKPELWDYADNIDTIDFLIRKMSTGNH